MYPRGNDRQSSHSALRQMRAHQTRRINRRDCTQFCVVLSTFSARKSLKTILLARVRANLVKYDDVQTPYQR